MCITQHQSWTNKITRKIYMNPIFNIIFWLLNWLISKKVRTDGFIYLNLFQYVSGGYRSNGCDTPFGGYQHMQLKNNLSFFICVKNEQRAIWLDPFGLSGWTRGFYYLSEPEPELLLSLASSSFFSISLIRSCCASISFWANSWSCSFLTMLSSFFAIVSFAFSIALW